jgi:hypothetical protein
VAATAGVRVELLEQDDRERVAEAEGSWPDNGRRRGTLVVEVTGWEVSSTRVDSTEVEGAGGPRPDVDIERNAEEGMKKTLLWNIS